MLYQFISSILGVKDKEYSYFQTHIHEAIELNQKRLLQYAELSQNESKKISRMLIRNEKLTLWLALYFDYKAKFFHKNNIPILKDIFVSMNCIPAFQEGADKFDRTQTPILLNAKSIKVEIRNAYSQGSFLEVYKTCKAINAKLKYPQYNCMLRHLIESMERISYFAPQYIEQAKKNNLPSPKKLFKRLLFIHLVAIGKAFKIDNMAYPLQKKGILILCNDLPNLSVD